MKPIAQVLVETLELLLYDQWHLYKAACAKRDCYVLEATEFTLHNHTVLGHLAMIEKLKQLVDELKNDGGHE